VIALCFASVIWDIEKNGGKISSAVSKKDQLLDD
jgi:hypothetical protein